MLTRAHDASGNFSSDASARIEAVAPAFSRPRSMYSLHAGECHSVAFSRCPMEIQLALWLSPPPRRNACVPNPSASLRPNARLNSRRPWITFWPTSGREAPGSGACDYRGPQTARRAELLGNVEFEGVCRAILTNASSGDAWTGGTASPLQ